MPNDTEKVPRDNLTFVDKTLIKPLELDDAQGRWIFAPQADITALEAVLISQMWAAITVRYLKGDQSRFDWREYLLRDRNVFVVPKIFEPDTRPIPVVLCDLTRHFKPMA